MVCEYCGADKTAEDYTPQSKRKCRACIYAENNARYHRHSKRYLVANRRAAHRRRFANRVAKAPQHSVAERAYAAGLLDGEGCITICRHRSHPNRGRYQSLVVVTSTTKVMIDWLQSRWGGHVRLVVPAPEMNRKPSWHWRVGANEALRLLDDVFDFLTVKRRQAQLVRRFQRYAQVSGRKRTPKVERVHFRIYAEIRRLNHRGIGPLPLLSLTG